MARMVALILSVALLTSSALGVAAQEAKPGTVTAAECIAPALPPGKVTPPDRAAGTDVADAGDATAEPTPVPEGVPADQATIDRFVAAEENLNACLNVGDFEGAAALFSPAGLEFFFGSINPYDAAANLAGYPA